MKKEYTSKIIELNKSIERDCIQLESLEAKLTSIKSTSDFEHTPFLKNNFNNYKIEYLLDQKRRVHKRYQDSVKELEGLKQVVILEIDKIEDASIKDVMYLRYIYCLEFGKIAETLNYSIESVYKKHRQGCKYIN